MSINWGIKEQFFIFLRLDQVCFKSKHSITISPSEKNILPKYDLYVMWYLRCVMSSFELWGRLLQFQEKLGSKMYLFKQGKLNEHWMRCGCTCGSWYCLKGFLVFEGVQQGCSVPASQSEGCAVAACDCEGPGIRCSFSVMESIWDK